MCMAIDVLLLNAVLNSGVGDVIICKCSIYDFCKIVSLKTLKRKKKKKKNTPDLV